MHVASSCQRTPQRGGTSLSAAARARPDAARTTGVASAARRGGRRPAGATGSRTSLSLCGLTLAQVFILADTLDEAAKQEVAWASYGAPSVARVRFVA